MDSHVRLSTKLCKDSNLTGNQRSLIMAIASYMPHAFPSIQTLQKDTGLCRNTVFKHLRILEFKGLIKRINRWGTTNLYLLDKTIYIARRKYEQAKKFVETEKAKWTAFIKQKSGTPGITTSQTLTRKDIYKQTNKDENFVSLKEFAKNNPKEGLALMNCGFLTGVNPA